MKKWMDAVTLTLLAFSAGYLTRELVREDERAERALSRLTDGGRKAKASAAALLRRMHRAATEDVPPAVIEIERADGTLCTVEDTEDSVTSAEPPAEVSAAVLSGAAGDEMPAEVAERLQLVRETLAGCGISLKEKVEWFYGPTVTRLEFYPEAGVRWSDAEDFAATLDIALAAPVRLEAPVSGKPAFAVEIPNLQRRTVTLPELWESEAYRAAKKPLTAPLGIAATGEVKLLSLAQAPHLLIAGSTGTGKSICIHGILLSLMRRYTPAELRLILLDPKQVEFTAYAHAPHLYLPVVTDCREALATLMQTIEEMERRYALLRVAGVRSVESYNEAVKGDPDRAPLPYLVVVLDELEDLQMLFAGQAVNNALIRLAQKARAAGIHLIVGTQRPTADVIPGYLKCNIPTRIAFRVPTQADSCAILDEDGAEALIGKGDMLCTVTGEYGLARVQGAFVSDAEIERTVGEVREGADVGYDEAFMSGVERHVAELIQSPPTADEDE